jgi:hypothetical protein
VIPKSSVSELFLSRVSSSCFSRPLDSLSTHTAGKIILIEDKGSVVVVYSVSGVLLPPVSDRSPVISQDGFGCHWDQPLILKLLQQAVTTHNIHVVSSQNSPLSMHLYCVIVY